MNMEAGVFQMMINQAQPGLASKKKINSFIFNLSLGFISLSLSLSLGFHSLVLGTSVRRRRWKEISRWDLRWELFL